MIEVDSNMQAKADLLMASMDRFHEMSEILEFLISSLRR